MKGIRLEFTDNDEYVEIELRDDYINKKEAEGFTVLEPKLDQVFLDIDSDEDYEEFKKRLLRLIRLCCSDNDALKVKMRTYISKSGNGHRHIIVSFPFYMSAGDKIAIQFALNSDPMREFMGICRVINRNNRPNVLFVPRADKE